MKKLLLAAIFLFMSVTTMQAMDNRMIAYANPMPNLVRIVQGNAELLGLDAKQMQAVDAWVQGNRAKMREMMQSLMEAEKMLKENALTTDTDIEKQVDNVLAIRKNIMMQKSACIAELKKILTPEQYANVVKIYRSVQPVKMMRGKQ